MYDNYASARIKELQNVLDPYLRAKNLSAISNHTAQGDVEVSFVNRGTKMKSPVTVRFGGVASTGFKSAKWSMSQLVVFGGTDKETIVDLGETFRSFPVYSLLSFVAERVNFHGTVSADMAASSTHHSVNTINALNNRIAEVKQSKSLKGAQLQIGKVRSMEPWEGLQFRPAGPLDHFFYEMKSRPFRVTDGTSYYKFYRLLDEGELVAGIVRDIRNSNIDDIIFPNNQLPTKELAERIDCFIEHNFASRNLVKRDGILAPYSKFEAGLVSGLLSNKYRHDGHLDLSAIDVVKLPDDFTVTGTLKLSKPIPWPQRLVVGDLDISRSSIEELPRGMQILGRLTASYSKLNVLPEDLDVKSVVITNTPIEAAGNAFQKLAGKYTITRSPSVWGTIFELEKRLDFERSSTLAADDANPAMSIITSGL